MPQTYTKAAFSAPHFESSCITIRASGSPKKATVAAGAANEKRWTKLGTYKAVLGKHADRAVVWVVSSEAYEVQVNELVFTALWSDDAAVCNRTVNRPNMTASEFLSQFYQTLTTSGENAAMDFVIDKMDLLLGDGQFEDCDLVLRAIDFKKLSTSLVRAFLMASRHGRGSLGAYGQFFRRAQVFFVEKRGAEIAERLLKPFG